MSRHMIITMGIKSVRMDDVANVMGMSKRTLYEMFGDKEELLYESIIHHREKMHRALKERAEGLRQCAGDGADVLPRDIQPLGRVGVASDEQHEEVLSQNL